MTDPAQIHSGYADVQGARLYYEIAGEGYPLILLHAGIADCRMWDDQMAALAARYLTVRYDLRGYGRSSHPPGEFSNHDDLAGLLDALGLESAALAGLSLGAATALDFALTTPERVDALVLAAPSAGGHAYSTAALEGWEQIDAALERGDPAAAVETELRMWVDGPTRQPDEVDAELRERVRVMIAPLYEGPPGEGRERRLNPPALTRLGEIDAPTLVIVGAQDMPDTMTIADRLEAGIRGARKVVISHVAHLINMERPLKFNELVVDFLEAVGE